MTDVVSSSPSQVGQGIAREVDFFKALVLGQLAVERADVVDRANLGERHLLQIRQPLQAAIQGDGSLKGDARSGGVGNIHVRQSEVHHRVGHARLVRLRCGNHDIIQIARQRHHAGRIVKVVAAVVVAFTCVAVQQRQRYHRDAPRGIVLGIMQRIRIIVRIIDLGIDHPKLCVGVQRTQFVRPRDVCDIDHRKVSSVKFETVAHLG